MLLTLFIRTARDNAFCGVVSPRCGSAPISQQQSKVLRFRKFGVKQRGGDPEINTNAAVGCLSAYSVNFKTRTTAAPADFEMTAAKCTSYGVLHDLYIAALAAVNTVGARSKALVAAKNSARKNLLAVAREYYAQIQASLVVTDANKTLLNITIRNTEPTPRPAPSVVPAVAVISVYGRNARLSIKDASGARRGRPVGCAGASLFSFVGENPPLATEGWRAEGNITRTPIVVQFDDDVAPGTKVWFCAFWYSQRGLSGAACTPVSAHIGYEGALPLAE